MLKACIFDLDGTLANTLDSMAYVANEIMEKFGLTPQPVSNFKYYCGEGANMLVRRCLRDAGDPDLNCYEVMGCLYRERFDANPLYNVTCYEGIPELLKELKKRGVRLAVCSNKPHVPQKVISRMFGDTFDTVIGQREGIRRKPAPDSALMGAKELGVSPSECLYIGDTGTDMQTGNAAQMHTVGVLWGFRTREELEANHAGVIIERPEEIIKIYEGEEND